MLLLICFQADVNSLVQETYKYETGAIASKLLMNTFLAPLPLITAKDASLNYPQLPKCFAFCLSKRKPLN